MFEYVRTTDKVFFLQTKFLDLVQTPAPAFLGIGQSGLKCLRAYPVAPLDMQKASTVMRQGSLSSPGPPPVPPRAGEKPPPLEPPMVVVPTATNVRLARIIWPDPKSVLLHTADGQEQKFKA